MDSLCFAYSSLTTISSSSTLLRVLLNTLDAFSAVQFDVLFFRAVYVTS